MDLLRAEEIAHFSNNYGLNQRKKQLGNRCPIIAEDSTLYFYTLNTTLID